MIEILFYIAILAVSFFSVKVLQGFKSFENGTVLIPCILLLALGAGFSFERTAFGSYFEFEKLGLTVLFGAAGAILACAWVALVQSGTPTLPQLVTSTEETSKVSTRPGHRLPEGQWHKAGLGERCDIKT